MIEYNYPECTTSVLSALKVFSKKFPEYRREEIECVAPPFHSPLYASRS
jgi:hypothetical protein